MVQGPEVDAVGRYFHELAVDREAWGRKERFTYDAMVNSLLEGNPIPGCPRGQGGPGSSIVQGLVLGFDSKTMDYTNKNLCPPCEWVSGSMVKLAEAVVAGLDSIAGQVADLGAGEGKPAPFQAAMWGVPHRPPLVPAHRQQGHRLWPHGSMATHGGLAL